MSTFMKFAAAVSLAGFLSTGAAHAQATSGGVSGGEAGNIGASPSDQGPDSARMAPAGGPRAQIMGQVPGSPEDDGRPAIPPFGPIPPNAG